MTTISSMSIFYQPKMTAYILINALPYQTKANKTKTNVEENRNLFRTILQ